MGEEIREARKVRKTYRSAYRLSLALGGKWGAMQAAERRRDVNGIIICRAACGCAAEARLWGQRRKRAPPGRGDSVLGGGEQGMKQVERPVSAEETEAISM